MQNLANNIKKIIKLAIEEQDNCTSITTLGITILRLLDFALEFTVKSWGM